MIVYHLNIWYEMSCICEDVTYESIKTCQKCKIQVTQLSTDRMTCPVHKPVLICGTRYYFCEDCKEAGWYSDFGIGGSADLINSKTRERVRYQYDESDSEEDSESW